MRCYYVKARLSCKQEFVSVRFHVKAVNEFDAAYHGMNRAMRLSWRTFYDTDKDDKIFVHIESVEDVTEDDMEVCEDEKSDC